MFTLNSDIKISSFRFSGVNDLVIKRSMHSYVQTATIKLPSRSVVKRKNGNIENVVTGKLFTDGDPVTINLGYNGALQEEFRGFVVRRNLNMPLEIECEGYSYQLRKNNVEFSKTKTTVKEALTAALKDTTIKLTVANDLALYNVVCTSKTGADLLDLC